MTNEELLCDENLEKIREGINLFSKVCHGVAVNAGWWTDLKTGLRKERNDGEMLMLIVSELAEAMEARGYGQSKNQSRYRPITYTTRDLSLLASGFVAAIAMVAL